MHQLIQLFRLFHKSRDTVAGGSVQWGKPGAERRAFARAACPTTRATCQFYRLRDGAWWSPQIVDLSAGGIGFIQTRPLSVGMLLTVELACPERSFLRRFLAEVVHVASSSDALRIGAAFVRPLTAEELRSLLP